MPSHPDRRDAEPPGVGPPGTGRLRGVVIALLALMIVLHVTGVVGAGTNG